MSAKRVAGPYLGLAPDDNGTGDAYEALADLFLGDPRGGGSERREAGGRGVLSQARRAPVELLLLGHLPVLGAAWAMQYARQASSDAAGPVAMLRLRGGEISLELVGGPNREGEPMPNLQAAVEAVSPLVRRWIIRVDDMAEPLALQLPEVDTITLLSGADEAAVVSAYQTIKDLPVEKMCEVKLAIMGAAPERAIASAERIAKTAVSHLGRRITVAACISRIGGARSSLYHRGPLVGDEVAVLSGVLRQIRSPGVTRIRQVTVSPPGSVIEAKPPVQPEQAPAAVSTPAAAAPATAKPRAEETTSRSASSHLGLELLPFRCPLAPDVELAVDADGRLHLVGNADERLVQVGALQAASIWAKQNAEVLRLASGTCGKPMASDAAAVMHLVTTNARWVRPVLDGDIRLHMLVVVRIDGREGRCLMDLN